MRKSEKVSYEVDPFNRLICKKSGQVSRVAKFRNVIDGRFRIDKKNTLTYHLKNPQNSLPTQLKLSGDWSLDKDHNLLFTLDKENNQRVKDRLTLKGEIIDTKSDKLEFSVSTKDLDGKTHFYILQLGGRWQADRYNRLNFLVRKENGLNNRLILRGAWEINKQNQIIYTYTKSALKTKKKHTHTLSLEGFWDITKKYRLLYILNRESNSGFDFKVSLGKPAKRGLQYEVGIGVIPKNRTLILSGSWKINQRLGLLYEMPLDKGRLRRINFGATCKLDKDYNLELKLKSARQEDLGINLKLSKKILKDQGEAFLEALKEGREIALLAGLGLRW